MVGLTLIIRLVSVQLALDCQLELSLAIYFNVNQLIRCARTQLLTRMFSVNISEMLVSESLDIFSQVKKRNKQKEVLRNCYL